MSLLLSFADQQTYIAISANNQNKYNQIAFEVENNELRDLLGVALLQDVQTNPATDSNIKLLSGTSFTDKWGNTVNHRGLKFVLAYLNYSRYLGESFVADTFSGFVQKNRPDSEQLSEGAIKRLQQNKREIALSEFELIRYYLDTNTDLFPLWNRVDSVKPFTPKFKGVKKTLYGRENLTVNKIIFAERWQ